MAKSVQSIPTAPAADVRCRYSITVTGDGFFLVGALHHCQRNVDFITLPPLDGKANYKL